VQPSPHPFIDWLQTPGGLEFTNAVAVLLIAIAGYFSFLAHRQSSENAKMLNGHLEEHVDAEKHK
jgi:hypothetical protein